MINYEEIHLHILSREVAQELGLKLFATGNSCKSGHISYRRTYSKNCVVCAQLVQKTPKNAAYHRAHRRKSYAKETFRDVSEVSEVGGFNPDSPAYFYLVTISKNCEDLFIGFGITSFPESRINTHKRNCAQSGYTMEVLNLTSFDNGYVPARTEQLFKALFKIVNTGIEGFKCEAIPFEKYTLDSMILLLGNIKTAQHQDKWY